MRRWQRLHGQEDGQTREIIEESLLHLLLLPCGNKKCFPHHVAIKSSQEAEEGTEDLTCSSSPSSLCLTPCPTIAMAACLLDKEGYNFKRQKQENTLASGEFRLAFFFKKETTTTARQQIFFSLAIHESRIKVPTLLFLKLFCKRMEIVEVEWMDNLLLGFVADKTLSKTNAT